VIRTAFAFIAVLAAATGWIRAEPQASNVPTTPVPAATDSAPTSGEAIYLRAVRAMKDAPQPPYVTFREDVSARNMRLSCTTDGTSLTLKHGDAAGSYRVWFRTSDERAVSEDVASQKRCSGALLYPAGAEIAALGAPSAAPSATASPAADGPPLIAAVRVESARYYHITLVDRETFEGHPVYRLALRAYRDPATHPLTDMLVDAQTFLVRQAAGEAAAHYVIASGRVAGVVTFDRSGPYWLARDETFDLAAQAIFVHAHCTVSVRATDFAFPDDVGSELASPSPSPSPGPRRR
jgi:hypothetical protein